MENFVYIAHDSYSPVVASFDTLEAAMASLTEDFINDRGIV